MKLGKFLLAVWYCLVGIAFVFSVWATFKAHPAWLLLAFGLGGYIFGITVDDYIRRQEAAEIEAAKRRHPAGKAVGRVHVQIPQQIRRHTAAEAGDF